MAKLELRHFQAVLALRECRTTGAAAERLGLTQSAVSHQLAEAERRLGCTLFNRSGRLLHLNTAGALLASSAETILAEVAHVERSLAPASGASELRTIRIATFAYSAYRWLPAFLRLEASKQANLAFEFVASGPGVPVRAIETGTADLGIIAGDIASDQVESLEIFRDQLVCVLPKGHRLSAKRFVIADDFMEEPFITYSAYAESGFEEDFLWRRAGKRPKLVNAGHSDAVIEMVKAGFGLGILSQWAVVQSGASADLDRVPVTAEGLTLRWSAVFRRSHQDYERLRAMAQSLSVWCKEADLAS
ncbi:MAG: LysR family transcriptional regulator [Pseudomonadota bacterium]